MSKEWGPVVYYLEVLLTGGKPGEKLRQHRIGPFLSLDAAEAEMLKQKQTVDNTGGACDFKIVTDVWSPVNRN
jgi:hypothetical protein